MNYAVITLSSKQHVVSVGEKLQVDRLPQEEGKTFDIKDVLLVATDGNPKIGTPLVEGAKVTVKVLSHEKGEKIRVATFKAKSRERKVRGHRQALSTVEIVNISE